MRLLAIKSTLKTKAVKQTILEPFGSRFFGHNLKNVSHKTRILDLENRALAFRADRLG